MTNKLTKLPITVYYAGKEATAGRPAYCLVEELAWYDKPTTDRSGYRGIRVMSPAEAQLYILREQAKRPPVGWSKSFSTVCFPEVPPSDGSAPYTSVDVREGWNAAADSVFNASGDFAFTFDYARFPVGVIVGIAPYPTTGTLPSTVKAGVYLSDGAIRVMAAGVEVAAAPYGPLEQPAIAISRRGGECSIRVGDAQYTMDGVPASQLAQIRSLLYLAGDYVDNPRFIIDTEGSVRGGVGMRLRVPDVARARGGLGLRMPAKTARGGVAFTGRARAVADYVTRAVGNAAFGGVIGPPGGEGKAGLPRLSVYGGLAGSSPRGAGAPRLPSLRVEANGGYQVPSWAGGAASLPALMLGGVVQVGEVATGELSIGALSVVGADDPYAHGRATLGRLSVLGLEPLDSPGNATLYEAVRVGDGINSNGLLYAILNSEVGVGASITFSMLMGAAMYDSLLLRDRSSLAATIDAVMRAGITLSDQAARGDWPEGNAHYAAVQYATNVLTGAVTRFDGFNFSGFCRAAQQSYGVSESGLYRIGHTAEPIDAIVEFAAFGGESAAVKKLSYVYVGLASDGAVYVAVDDDSGARNVYEAVESREMWRAQAAKGAQSRQWTVTLMVSQATQAELDSIVWMAPATARRFGR